MRTFGLVIMFIIGIAVGHIITPLIANNEVMRKICPFVTVEKNDPDEVFIKLLTDKYRIIIREKENNE